MKPVRRLLSPPGVALLGVLAGFDGTTPEAHALRLDAAGGTARGSAQPLLQMTDAGPQERPAGVLAPPQAEGRETGEVPSRQPAPRTAAAEPLAPAGNPVSEVPLSQLSSTQERPIFSPSRRPPPPPKPASVAPMTVRPQVKPPALERPAVSLVGTVIGTDVHIGVFLETATKNVVRLRVGETHQGWVVRLIRPDEVTLVKDGAQSVVLNLPPPGDGSGGLPRVAAGIVPIVSNENYVDEQPLPVRGGRGR